MGKLLKRTGILFLLVCFVWCGLLLADKDRINSKLEISDLYQLQDSISESLSKGLKQITDVNLAKEYLQEQLPKFENFINEAFPDVDLYEQSQKLRQFFMECLGKIENFFLKGETYPVFGTHCVV